MNFLKFNKYLQSDNDGTFWPGYIEIPDEEGLPSEYDTDNEEKLLNALLSYEAPKHKW